MGWSCDLSVIYSAANLHCLPRRTSSSRPCFSASAHSPIFPSLDTLSLSSPSQLAFSRSVSLPAARLGSICSSFRDARHLPKASEYVFPDPIPEFAEAETSKFKKYMVERLSKKDLFGNHLEEIVGICSEILGEFLHTEYGGPGTLLVLPFIDMADMINERGLPGGPQAARAAVVWAQKNVDIDWKEWTTSVEKAR